MKIVLREWLKDKSACVLAIVGLIARIAVVILSAEVTLQTAITFEDLQHWQDHLVRLLVLLTAQLLCAVTVSMSAGVSRHNIFTTLNDLYADKVLYADYNMFTKFSCSRVVTASEQIWKISASGGTITNIILSVVSVIVLAVNIWRVAPKLVWSIILTYEVGLILMKIVYTFYSKIDNESDTIKRKRNQEIDETINGFAEVRAFTTEHNHAGSIHGMNRQIVLGRRKRAYVNAGLNVVINTIDMIAIAIVVIYSVSAIEAGTLSIATAMAIVTFTYRIIDPLIQLLEDMDDLSMNLSQISEYDKIVTYENSDAGDENVDLDIFENEIRFDNVSFAYEKSSNVLEGLSLVIPKGKKIGICGTSGGGKTTIMKLLMKYYVPQGGDITVDGVSYRKLSPDSIRKKIGIVHQENHIFATSIYNNIIYGNWDCSEEEVYEACRKANIYEFIQSLPEKFNTEVGPRGLKLSGGQKQRIALARVFLSNPEIILLDEATSSLDNTSERIIQDAMKMFADKTVVTIAHRLSTIQDSDIIYVINDHKVAESGTHKQLLKHSKIYKELQSKEEDE